MSEDEFVRILSSMRFDQYGTPDRKWVDCPICEEDELMGMQQEDYNFATCLRCSTKWMVKQDRKLRSRRKHRNYRSPGC